MYITYTICIFPRVRDENSITSFPRDLQQKAAQARLQQNKRRRHCYYVCSFLAHFVICFDDFSFSFKFFCAYVYLFMVNWQRERQTGKWCRELEAITWRVGECKIAATEHVCSSVCEGVSVSWQSEYLFLYKTECVCTIQYPSMIEEF